MKRSTGAITALVVTMTALSSCATVQVKPLPEPPPTAKLRVYVEAFTRGRPGMKWGTPHEEYAKNQRKRTGKYLEKKGIYEVVSDGDVNTVIGDRMLSYELLQGAGWENARIIGRALHADFVLVASRDKSNVGTGEWNHTFSTELVNVATGSAYRSTVTVNNVIASDAEFATKLTRESYRELFIQAKHDMMGVAVRKGRAYAPPAAPVVPQKMEPAPSSQQAAKMPEQTTVSMEVPKTAVQQDSPPVRAAAPPASAKTSPAADPSFPGLFAEPKKESGAKKLVVYDLESSEQYRTVALILAEALREEVFKMKQYVLVNREDLQKVLEEMALQQTGLVDEKEAVKTGKGLAASQVVTGRLGQLGKVFVMQAKRVDVETFGTLGLASIKFTEGAEDEVLDRLPEFAKELVGLR